MNSHGDGVSACDGEAMIARARLGDRIQRASNCRSAIAPGRNGPDHPELTPTLNNLAMLLDERGQLAESARLYQRTFAILEGTVESNHPILVACCANYQKSACCLR